MDRDDPVNTIILNITFNIKSCWMTDQSVNALADKAEITHWCIDGQSGDDGGSFLQMIRYIARPCPKVAYKRHFYVKIWRFVFGVGGGREGISDTIKIVMVLTSSFTYPNDNTTRVDVRPISITASYIHISVGEYRMILVRCRTVTCRLSRKQYWQMW